MYIPCMYVRKMGVRGEGDEGGVGECVCVCVRVFCDGQFGFGGGGFF